MAVSKHELKLAVPGVLVAIVAFLLSPEKGLPFAMAFGVFVVVVDGKRESWTHARFWIIIAVLAISHLVVICLVHFPQPRASVEAIPYAFADFFVVWGLVNGIERLFPYTRQPDHGGQH